jgi:hypothetical protein
LSFVHRCRIFGRARVRCAVSVILLYSTLVYFCYQVSAALLASTSARVAAKNNVVAGASGKVAAPGSEVSVKKAAVAAAVVKKAAVAAAVVTDSGSESGDEEAASPVKPKYGHCLLSSSLLSLFPSRFLAGAFPLSLSSLHHTLSSSDDKALILDFLLGERARGKAGNGFFGKKAAPAAMEMSPSANELALKQELERLKKQNQDLQDSVCAAVAVLHMYPRVWACVCIVEVLENAVLAEFVADLEPRPSTFLPLSHCFYTPLALSSAPTFSSHL